MVIDNDELVFPSSPGSLQVQPTNNVLESDAMSSDSNLLPPQVRKSNIGLVNYHPIMNGNSNTWNINNPTNPFLSTTLQQARQLFR